MEHSSRSSQQTDTLRETAARLIDAVGIDSAIFVCRSNYWHGVLRFVLERKDRPQLVVAASGRPVQQDRPSLLPQPDAWSELPAAA